VRREGSVSWVMGVVAWEGKIGEKEETGLGGKRERVE
jgi:hypothetical protein